MQTIDYDMIEISPSENRRDVRRSFLWNFQQGMEGYYYMQVMDYLQWQRPDELMRETFRANCERIYEKDKELYEKAWLNYYGLYNWRDLQQMLEEWNDLYSNNDDDDNTN